MAKSDDGSNLIVNYLPPTLTDADFKSMFEAIGPVSASKIIRDRTTGLSYGYGFIDFVDPSHAIRAIEALDGMQLQNKRLKVCYRCSTFLFFCCRMCSFSVFLVVLVLERGSGGGLSPQFQSPVPLFLRTSFPFNPFVFFYY